MTKSIKVVIIYICCRSRSHHVSVEQSADSMNDGGDSDDEDGNDDASLSGMLVDPFNNRWRW